MSEIDEIRTYAEAAFRDAGYSTERNLARAVLALCDLLERVKEAEVVKA